MVGDRYAQVENENLLHAYTAVDLTLTRPISHRIDVFGGVENLLDEVFEIDFQSEGNTYGLRRTFQLGVRFRSL